MSAYLEGRTTRLSSTETSRSRSSQEDFLCGEPPAVAAEPQYHPGPLVGGTTHSGRKPGGSSSSDVQYRCDPVEVRRPVHASNSYQPDCLKFNVNIYLPENKLFIDIANDSDWLCVSLIVSCSTVRVLRGEAVRRGLPAGHPHPRDVPGRT